MGRKPKCTVEEKIPAVEDYLNGIRSVSEIMVDLSIKSTRTIRDWILAYQNGGIKASSKQVYQQYSEYTYYFFWYRRTM